MKLKRLVLIIAGLVLLAVVLCVGGGVVSRIAGETLVTPTPEEEKEQSEISVRARGEVAPAEWADLSFGAAGQVAEWFVEEGEIVEAGASIGRLDTGELERAVAQAELSLEEAHVRLEELQRPAEEYEIREAENAVAQAAAALGVARLNLSTVLSSTLLNETMEDAQEVFDDKKTRYEETLVDYESGEIRDYWFVDEARKEYDEALRELIRLRQQADLQLGDARNGIDQAQRDYQEAQDRLERLLAGADPLELEAAQLEIEAARLSLEEAQSNLEKATLVAPFDGAVVTLHLRPHDRVGAGALAVTLADLSSLWVETTDLDEWGAAQIDVGDEAEIVFNAFDDKTLTGHVSEIDLRGETLPAGDVVYRAIIELDEPDPELRWGMTVRITIPLEQ